jgi:hypothetical protein
VSPSDRDVVVGITLATTPNRYWRFCTDRATQVNFAVPAENGLSRLFDPSRPMLVNWDLGGPKRGRVG